MTDKELDALATLVWVETSAMIAENEKRRRQDNAPAYGDSEFTGMDCVRCLDAELRIRGVLK
jgi:hypothetical protein